MQEHVDTNQTHFAAQEPYLDTPTNPRTYKPGDDDEAPVKPVVWWKNRNTLLGGAVAFLIFLMVSLAVLFTSSGENPLVELEPSPSPTTQQSSEYQERLKILKDDLQKADPTQKELPFPPVSEEITL